MKKDMQNKIEIRRIYNIKTPEGIIIEIKRDTPLNEELKTKLIEEDNIAPLKDSRIIVLDNIKNKKRRYIKKKIIIRSPEEPEALAEKKEIPPVDRLNKMLEMEGDFTRPDYQRMLEESGYRISASIKHNDIQGALLLGKIEQIGGKGKELRIYRVIDSTPINKKGLRNLRKVRIGHKL